MDTDDLLRICSLLERIAVAAERTADAVELLAAKAHPAPPRPPEGSPPSKVHPLAALDAFRRLPRFSSDTTGPTLNPSSRDAWGWLRPHLLAREVEEINGGLAVWYFAAWCDRVEARLRKEAP